MESFFVRYRNLLVLLAVVLLQIIGLAMQVRRTASGYSTLDAQDATSVRLIRLWANMIVSPPEKLIHTAGHGTGSLWHDYLALYGVREQNVALQSEIDRLRLEQASILEDARQGQRLQALLGFQKKYIYTTVAAQVIGTSGSDQSRIFTLDKGANAGLKRDMAVITADGIVGKIREVFPLSAQVLLINDQTSGAGVMLETTRLRGILRGNAYGQTQVVGILSDQRIQPGEKIVTAGGDMIFPSGLPVGVVAKVVRDPERDGFIDILVNPAAHINQLDEVLVITSTAPAMSDQQQKDLATSEALKGAEAEKLKAQKKAAETMSEHLPGLTDPNAAAKDPSQQDQPGSGRVTVPPAPKLLSPAHSDRFTPAGTAPPKPGTVTTPVPQGVE